MPIYEYECEKCSTPTDVLQKIGEKAPSKCEKCGAKGKMKRRVSKSSFVLKGGGWGADLYGSKKSGSSSSSDKAASSSDKASSSSDKASTSSDKTSTSSSSTTSTSSTPSTPTTTSTTGTSSGGGSDKK